MNTAQDENHQDVERPRNATRYDSDQQGKQIKGRCGNPSYCLDSFVHSQLTGYSFYYSTVAKEKKHGISASRERESMKLVAVCVDVRKRGGRETPLVTQRS